LNQPLAKKPPSTSPVSISIIDRNVKMQHSDEWGLRFEREIAPETSLSLSYVNRKYYDQLQDVDINKVPVLWDDVPDSISVPGYDPVFKTNCNQINGKYADCFGLRFPSSQGNRWAAAPDGQADLEALNPFFSNVYKIGNFNRSFYEAYIVRLTRRFYQNWQLDVSYTWSKSIGQAEDFFQQLGDDQTNIDDEFGFLSDDQRHVVKINGRVVVPWWGGLRIGGAFFYSSGQPFSVIEQRTAFDYPTNLGRVDADHDYGTKYQQTASVRILFPTHQRNDRRQPSWWNFDVNVQKEFNLKDINASLEFGIFNLLNSDDLRNMQTRQVRLQDDQGEFRAIRQTIAQRRLGRQFQIALRLKF